MFTFLLMFWSEKIEMPKIDLIHVYKSQLEFLLAGSWNVMVEIHLKRTKSTPAVTYSHSFGRIKSILGISFFSDQKIKLKVNITGEINR